MGIHIKYNCVGTQYFINKTEYYIIIDGKIEDLRD